MNLIDLLLKIEIPAWIVLIIAAIGVTSIAYYKFLLNKKLKNYEYALKNNENKRTKILELATEQFRNRLNALAELNRFLVEFDHSIRHIYQGHNNYVKDLEHYYKNIRTLSRKHELLLSKDFYHAIIRYTDLGKTILNSKNFNMNKYVKELNGIESLIEDFHRTLPNFD